MALSKKAQRKRNAEYQRKWYRRHVLDVESNPPLCAQCGAILKGALSQRRGICHQCFPETVAGREANRERQRMYRERASFGAALDVGVDFEYLGHSWVITGTEPKTVDALVRTRGRYVHLVFKRTEVAGLILGDFPIDEPLRAHIADYDELKERLGASAVRG